jgi:hypothetical protein
LRKALIQSATFWRSAGSGCGIAAGGMSPFSSLPITIAQWPLSATTDSTVGYTVISNFAAGEAPP